MASSNILRWSTAVLLSLLAGCSSSEKSATCADPSQMVCASPTGAAACYSVQTDPSNCGSCGIACTAGQTCQAGVCTNSAQNGCSTGYTPCQVGAGPVCVMTATDPTNCGACGVACGATAPMCSNGTCVATCGVGLTPCGSSCVDVLSNAANCGTCGVACPATYTCVAGGCKAPNPAGTGGGSSVGGASGVAGGSNKAGSSGLGGAGTGGSKATGGTGTKATGGAGTGGTKATGGTSTAGSTLTTGARPKGYYTASDWGVSSVDWHGCAWTGIDNTISGSTTNITPTDFLAVADGGPYSVKGSIHKSYEAVAMVGFNLSEAITGNSAQCAAKTVAAATEGPPAVTMPASATGIAVNWSAAKAPPTSFRIQIQASDGATNGEHRWCATIKDSGGPSFVAFSDFYTNCWNVGVASPPADAKPVKYNKEAISAVIFLVPGTTAQVADFDFTIVGFAPGTSKDDAPGKPAECGTMTGTVGSTTASKDASMQRKRISGTDCKDYIVFNNNWGQPTNTTQVVDFVGNSFTIKSSSAAVSGQGVPGSFPSIYIGGNGDIAGGTFSTWDNSGLPKQISAITSIQTSLAWSGKSGGDFNTTYDVWFAKSQPTAGGYEDGISGLLMVWLYKPSSRSPIGSVKRSATIEGKEFDVWVGPRGTASTGTDGSGRPVVSYVAKSTLSSFSFDLKKFIDDAVKNGSADMSAGGTSQAFSNSWYLTDVFGGFEVWSGGDAAGLKETFTCVVK